MFTPVVAVRAAGCDSLLDNKCYFILLFYINQKTIARIRIGSGGGGTAMSWKLRSCPGCERRAGPALVTQRPGLPVVASVVWSLAELTADRVHRLAPSGLTDVSWPGIGECGAKTCGPEETYSGQPEDNAPMPSQSSKKIKQACDRCGTCCRQGGPALHIQDRHLVAPGFLGFDVLVTIRRGELARYPLSDRPEPGPFRF